MGKSKLQKNIDQHFILRRLNSIEIGLYIFLTAYLIKFISSKEIINNDFFQNLSITSLDKLSTSLFFITSIVIGFAMFFSSRRNARRHHLEVWTPISKKRALLYGAIVLTGLSINFFLNYNNLEGHSFIVYLLITSLILLANNSSKTKELYIISAVHLLLISIVVLIPSYWYSALLISGVSFFVFGVVTKND